MVGKPPNNSPSPIPRTPSRRNTQVPDAPSRFEVGWLQTPQPTEFRSPSTYVGQSTTVPLIATPVAVSIIPLSELSILHGRASVSSVQALEDFRVPVQPWPADIEAHGIWQFKERLYVAVDDGYFVQVARDPSTGYLRATMSRERTPSGPILQRDPVSAFWYPVDHPDGAAITPAPGRTVSRHVAQLFQRLGHSPSVFPDATVRRILAVSGIEEAQLPGSVASTASLADTLRRFRLDQDLQAFVTQMQNPDPAVYTQADPQLQIQLLQARGVNLHGNALHQGDLLRSLVAFLDEATLKTLLDEPASASDAQPDIDATLARLQQRMGDWAQRDRVNLFRSREEAFELDCDETTLQMRRIFPLLTKNAAQELWRNASAAERLHVHNSAGMPRGMAEQALLLQRDARLTRACEGLYLDAVSNPDSDRLAFYMIGNLAGWPQRVRIEIRHGETLLGAIGDARSPVRYVLLRQDAGYFLQGTEALSPQSVSDLYSVVWHVLQPAQRQALAVLDGGGQALRQLIRAQPLPGRQTVSEVLGLAPLPFAVEQAGGQYRQSGYLRGGADNTPASAKSVVERVRALYPQLSDEEVTTFINERLKRDPAGLVIRLEQEFATLRDELAIWSADEPSSHSQSSGQGKPPTAAERRQAREQFSIKLQDIWQRKSVSRWGYGDYHFSCDVDVFGVLPVLSARFEYVTELILTTRKPGTQIGAFLNSFPNVQYLMVTGVEMGEFPSGIFQMRELRQLTLNNCSLRLSEITAEGVARIETLTLLNLANNPLAVAPHVGFMPDLTELMLYDASLSKVPTGISRLKELQVLSLQDNNISEVGDELFDIPDTQDLFVGLVNNPLSSTSRQRIAQYLENASMDRKIEIQMEEPPSDVEYDSVSSESGLGTDSESD